MTEKIHNIRVARIWMEDGILHQNFASGAEIETNDLIELAELGNKFYKQENLVYVDMSNIKSVSYEARQYLKTKDASVNVKAMAFKVKSNISRIIGNFLNSVSNLDYPSKLFTDDEKAIKWLKQFE